ncbi:MAG: hypothetical protein A2Y17_04800 [Clostridiales bacterium GWF2_38_85]|nr:MAG: hypothetical protein A2Y17_04800 [Clostridiales bacterium GWF2_38_85]HBL84393.1 NUDIX pyrophosphatase [Clostridiales bacterium]
MRAPFQILAIPYRINNSTPLFCVMHRSDIDQWQFISGGGEDKETPIEAAQREIYEEAGIRVDNIIQLTSMCYIPTNIFPEQCLENWVPDTYVVPEYSFTFECNEDITLSHEHIEFLWLTYDEVYKTLKWDSNKTALYELQCRLENRC